MLRYRIRQSYRIVGMYRGIAFSFFMLIMMLFANHIVFDLKAGTCSLATHDSSCGFKPASTATRKSSGEKALTVTERTRRTTTGKRGK
jgi:hypothetical protein